MKTAVVRQELMFHLGRQLFIDGLPVADGHDTDHAHLSVDRIDNPKAADTVLPQPLEFAEQRHATFGLCGNRTDC